MNLEQSKAKLADVMRSTGTKHPKVLVSELCVVVQFLLNEVERLESKPILKLFPSLPSDVHRGPPHRRRDCGADHDIKTMPLTEKEIPLLPPEDPGAPIRSRPLTTDHPNRKGNAGDAK